MCSNPVNEEPSTASRHLSLVGAVNVRKEFEVQCRCRVTLPSIVAATQFAELHAGSRESFERDDDDNQQEADQSKTCAVVGE
jgi:hypothetical protein